MGILDSRPGMRFGLCACEWASRPDWQITHECHSQLRRCTSKRDRNQITYNQIKPPRTANLTRETPLPVYVPSMSNLSVVAFGRWLKQSKRVLLWEPFPCTPTPIGALVKEHVTPKLWILKRTLFSHCNPTNAPLFLSSCNCSFPPLICLSLKGKWIKPFLTPISGNGPIINTYCLQKHIFYLVSISPLNRYLANNNL